MSGGATTSPEPWALVGVPLRSQTPGKHNSGKPKDVVITFAMDQGRNVVNATNDLGVNAVLGNTHRLNSAICRMLGIAGSTSTCKNPPSMEGLMKRLAACVGKSTHFALFPRKRPGSSSVLPLLPNRTEPRLS